MDWTTMAWEETYLRFSSWLNNLHRTKPFTQRNVEDCFCHIIPCPALFVCT